MSLLSVLTFQNMYGCTPFLLACGAYTAPEVIHILLDAPKGEEAQLEAQCVLSLRFGDLRTADRGRPQLLPV